MNSEAESASVVEDKPDQINVILHRQTLLEDLSSTLDFLIFAEIAALYHLE
jgi:hypothetical protein